MLANMDADWYGSISAWTLSIDLLKNIQVCSNTSYCVSYFCFPFIWHVNEKCNILIILHSPHPLVTLFSICLCSWDRRECFKQLKHSRLPHERRRKQNNAIWEWGEWRIQRGECDPIYRYSVFVSHYSLHSPQWKQGITNSIDLLHFQ